jgi:hypothetical protein
MNQFTEEAVHEELLNIWRKEHRRTSEDVFKQLKEATWIVYDDLLGGVRISVRTHVRIRGAYNEMIFPKNDWTRDHNGRKIECKIRKCLWNRFCWRIIAQYK